MEFSYKVNSVTDNQNAKKLASLDVTCSFASCPKICNAYLQFLKFQIQANQTA